jgi:hypothetical protein
MGNIEDAVPVDVAANHQQLESEAPKADVKVLLVLPLTRRWAIDMQAKQLAALNRSSIDLHLLVNIDTDDFNASQVIDAFQKHEMTIPYTIHHTKAFAPQEVRIYARRDRIRDMLTGLQSTIRKKQLDTSDFMFMVEDDTMIEPAALQRLLADWRELTDAGVKVGFIEGAQVGRHGIRMIGAWRMDDLENPTVMSTIPFSSTALFEKIDGGGLYCFITPMELFLAHTWQWHDECFSVDVMYGIELRKKGYTNIIDWSVVAGHADQHGKVLVPNENCTVAEYKKADNSIWTLQPYKTKGGIS